jgi:hypothetical protein
LAAISRYILLKILDILLFDVLGVNFGQKIRLYGLMSRCQKGFQTTIDSGYPVGFRDGCKFNFSGTTFGFEMFVSKFRVRVIYA